MRVAALLLVCACERADEAAIGWHPFAAGDRLTSHMTSELRAIVPDDDRDHHSGSLATDITLEVLAIDGDRVSTLRFDIARNDKLLDGARVATVTGTFDVSAPNATSPPTITRTGGTVDEAARAYLTTRLRVVTTGALAKQRAFFTHRFHVGERYELSDVERDAFGLDEFHDVAFTCTAIRDRELELAVHADDGVGRAIFARDGSHHTMTLESPIVIRGRRVATAHTEQTSSVSR